MVLTWLSSFALAAAHDLDQRFTKSGFTLGTKPVQLYLADTDGRRERGLMFVDRLPKDTGMLFIFDQPQHVSFWMKNTVIPLAIGFFDAQCTLREVREMEVPESVLTQPPGYRSRDEVRFALEMPAGWFSAARVKPGAKLKLVRGARGAVCK